MQRDSSRDGHVERVDRGSDRDRDSIVSGGERRIRQASPFRADQQHDPTVAAERRTARSRSRHRAASAPLLASRAERSLSSAPRPWLGDRPGQLQHGAHRGTNGLAIQRVGGRGLTKMPLAPKAAAVLNRPPTLSGLPTASSASSTPSRSSQRIDRRNRRPARERKASSMEVEARDLLHRLRAADENVSVNGLEPAGQRLTGRGRRRGSIRSRTLRVHQAVRRRAGPRRRTVLDAGATRHRRRREYGASRGSVAEVRSCIRHTPASPCAIAWPIIGARHGPAAAVRVEDVLAEALAQEHLRLAVSIGCWTNRITSKLSCASVLRIS